jgi:adenylyl cyclase-associated protein
LSLHLELPPARSLSKDELPGTQLASYHHQTVRDQSSQSDQPQLIPKFLRLEAATSRLEDIAVVQSGGAVVLPESASARPASTVLAPSAGSAIQQQEPQPKFGSLSSDAAPDSVPASVSAFDDRIINEKLKPFVEQSNGLAQPLLVEQVCLQYRISHF